MAKFQLPCAAVPYDILVVLFYVASGFSGKAAALQQDRQRIHRTEFYVFVPIVPVEGLVSFDFSVLVGEPKEIVRNSRPITSMRDDPRTHKLMEGFYILSKISS